MVQDDIFYGVLILLLINQSGSISEQHSVASLTLLCRLIITMNIQETIVQHCLKIMIISTSMMINPFAVDNTLVRG